MVFRTHVAGMTKHLLIIDITHLLNPQTFRYFNSRVRTRMAFFGEKVADRALEYLLFFIYLEFSAVSLSGSKCPKNAFMNPLFWRSPPLCYRKTPSSYGP